MEKLLPFYANGTLQPEMHRDIEAWLAASPQARAELAFVQQMQAEVRAEAQPGPGELGLARLRRQIQTGKAPSAKPKKTAQGWSTGTWRSVAIAASVLLVAQSVWIGMDQPAPPGQISTGVRGDGPGPGVPDTRAVLEVRFAPSATLAEIAALLAEINAEFAGGPDVTGRYHLRLDALATDRPAIDAALTRLRAANTVVRFAGEGP